MEIGNANATPSKSNQLWNVNTVRWESRDVTTQPWEIDDRKTEVIAFVVNAVQNRRNQEVEIGEKFVC